MGNKSCISGGKNKQITFFYKKCVHPMLLKRNYLKLEARYVKRFSEMEFTINSACVLDFGQNWRKSLSSHAFHLKCSYKSSGHTYVSSSKITPFSDPPTPLSNIVQHCPKRETPPPSLDVRIIIDPPPLPLHPTSLIWGNSR